MSDDESLSLFGKEEKGGGVEVSGIGEPGRDTVRYLSYACDCIVEGTRDTLGQEQLQNQIKIIRFSRTKALLFSKTDHILAKIPVLGNLTNMFLSQKKPRS